MRLRKTDLIVAQSGPRASLRRPGRGARAPVPLLVAALVLACAVRSPGAGSRIGRLPAIQPADLRTWLSYFASDELEGRAVFSEGLGLAAAYLAAQLRAFGVEPAGDGGSYFQRVRVLGVKSTNRSTLTVESRGRVRTFRNGAGVRFPANVGGKRALTVERVEFVGYGLAAGGHDDLQGRSVAGAAAVWLGRDGPGGLGAEYRRLLGGRARDLLDRQGAVATLGPAEPAGGEEDRAEAAGNDARPVPSPGGDAGERPDFTTTERLDRPSPPSVASEDELLEFLFDGQQVGYPELKAKASRGEPLPRFTLAGVRLTFGVDADYRVVQTRLTRNVVGMVRGSDARLRDSYVSFGAHYDHVGYAEREIVQGGDGPKRPQAPGMVRDGALEDRIWNGADDDGSGSIAVLAVARAFAAGPRPRRSILFIWHAGEEQGLLGSRFFADYPVVPLEQVVAHVNIDMVGRNRDNRPEEANTVYVVGADRISTELHNLAIAANERLDRPLRLDFDLNDPAEPEGIYYRSDHYSYAAKGIPVVFLTTGLHPDYHANTDAADRIEYAKLARIAELCYQLGLRVADLDHAPVRDRRGPRVGRGGGGRLRLE